MKLSLNSGSHPTPTLFKRILIRKGLPSKRPHSGDVILQWSSRFSWSFGSKALGTVMNVKYQYHKQNVVKERWHKGENQGNLSYLHLFQERTCLIIHSGIILNLRRNLSGNLFHSELLYFTSKITLIYAKEPKWHLENSLPSVHKRPHYVCYKSLYCLKLFH